MKGRQFLRNSPGAFYSFNLLGLTGFVAAVGVVVAPATSVSAAIGDIAVPLVAITIGFILLIGFISAWFIWLVGPYVLTLVALIIKALRPAVRTSTAEDSPRFRQRLRTSCWKAGRWAIVLSLLWAAASQVPSAALRVTSS